MAVENVARVTVNLPVKVWEALSRMADEKGISKTEALRQAISTEVYLYEARKASGKILIERPDGITERVVFNYSGE